MKSLLFLLTLLFVAPAVRGAELIRAVVEPTAGVVAPRALYISLRTFPTDNLAFSLQAGLLPRLMAGIGYGGYSVTGMSTPDWFDKVYLKARFRFFDERHAFPGHGARGGFEGLLHETALEEVDASVQLSPVELTGAVGGHKAPQPRGPGMG